MRYAWQRSQKGLDEPEMTKGQRAAFISYNIIWWVPVILVIAAAWSYEQGAIGFMVITAARAVINLYRNNLLTNQAAQSFALRAP